MALSARFDAAHIGERRSYHCTHAIPGATPVPPNSGLPPAARPKEFA
ncbi:hypothetical protein [Streptomyces sp. UNOC14_S4]|nr:hypothetical protein [Streptomyces sp. UNOC14_S4]MCC3771092.1 hypothetical protein [Streptomyces sp. UNOC14_S4]